MCENDRKDLIAREKSPVDFPKPEDFFDKICSTCGGTTWVVRANIEVPGPLNAELKPCDNPACPQTRENGGPRDITILSVWRNGFNGVADLGGPNISSIFVK